MTVKSIALGGLGILAMFHSVGCTSLDKPIPRGKSPEDAVKAGKENREVLTFMPKKKTADDGPVLTSTSARESEDGATESKEVLTVMPKKKSAEDDEGLKGDFVVVATGDEESKPAEVEHVVHRPRPRTAGREIVRTIGKNDSEPWELPGKSVEFHDLTLEEAIQLTIQANPDLQSAQERTSIAEELLSNARAQFFPSLSTSAGYQVSNDPLRKFTFLLSEGVADPNRLFPLPGVGNIQHTQLHYEHSLYTGGLRQAQSRAARAEVDASMHSLESVRNRLVYQVAEAYYRVFQTRALVGVRREAVSQVESQLKEVRSRFEAKSVAKSDLLRVELRLAEVREALSTSINAHKLSMAILENVMGTPHAGRDLPQHLPPAPWSEHVNRIEGTVQEISEGHLPSDIEADVVQAVDRRPEVGETSSKREAAEHRVRAAKSGKYPTLGVVGDFDYYAGERDNANESFFFGLALSLNLFDGGRTSSNVRQAEAVVRDINAKQQRVKLDIELDVRKAHLQLKDARERLKSTAAARSSAEENLRQVESRYREQSATTTELLDAQVLLSDVRVRSTSAAADVEIARASLERAIGRLTTLVNPHAGHVVE